jgi:hypothetical protein
VEKAEVFAVLQGLFEEMRRRRMVFCGEKRGESVIKLEHYLVFRGEGKYATDFRFIFGARHDLCKGCEIQLRDSFFWGGVATTCLLFSSIWYATRVGRFLR